MKRNLVLGAVLAVAVALIGATAQAQCATGNCGGGYGGGVVGADGLTQPVCPGTRCGYHPRIYTPLYAARDHFSPSPVYAYSRHGVDAARTNVWNQQQMQQYAWHAQYAHWRWNQPTALVVPPTAAFQSEYNWGVGQTRSLPIYHQFGFNNPGVAGGVAPGTYPSTPYWPSSTSQFGVYPVRGPWN